MKLTYRQQEILKIGQKQNLIQIEDNRIIYLSQNKSYNFSDPEELVRAITYIELIIEHKYPSNRLELEVYPPRREPKLPADIVVYKADNKNEPYIVIECKANSTKRDIEEAKNKSNLLRKEADKLESDVLKEVIRSIEK